MRAYPLLVYVALTNCFGAGLAGAEGGKRTPAQSSASAGAGEVMCTPQGCRPVRKGCHLARIGQFNEEVCNNLPVSLQAK